MPLQAHTSDTEAPTNLLANEPNTERAIMRDRDASGLPQRQAQVDPADRHTHSLVFFLSLLILGGAIVYRFLKGGV